MLKLLFSLPLKTKLLSFLLVVTALLIWVKLLPYIITVVHVLKIVTPKLIFMYFIFNLYDLKNFDYSYFSSLCNKHGCALWFIYADLGVPYRLKELVYDIKILLVYLYNNLRFVPIMFFLLCLCLMFSVFYLLVAVVLTALCLLIHMSVILSSKICKNVVKLSPIPPFGVIGSLSKLAWFLFIFNPQTVSFSAIYVLLLAPSMSKSRYKKILENALFARLIGKSKWVVNFCLLVTKNFVVFLNDPYWKRKRKNFNTIYPKFLGFISDFVIVYCTNLYRIVWNCAIYVGNGKIYTNPDEPFISLYEVCNRFFQASALKKSLIKASNVTVGFKTHKGVGFVDAGNNSITSQTIFTFRNKYRVDGETYSSMPKNPGIRFLYPRPRSASIDDLSPEVYKDRQYVVSSYVYSKNVKRRSVDVLEDMVAKQHENRAILLKSLENIINILTLNSVNSNTFPISNPNMFKKIMNLEESSLLYSFRPNVKNEYIVQDNDPSKGIILAESDIISNLTSEELHFLENVKTLEREMFAVLENFNDLGVEGKIGCVVNFYNYVENMSMLEFVKFLDTGVIEFLSKKDGDITN